MRDPDKPIILNVRVEVPPHTVGDMLLCDDPEGYPLASYGFAVQQALAQRVGWDAGAEARLKEHFKGLAGKDWQRFWRQYVQAYIQSKLGIDFMVKYCDRCNKSIKPHELICWDNPDGRRVNMHKSCYDEWQEQFKD